MKTQSLSLPRMTIGKLAKVAGVGVEAIRFYQRRGLMDVPYVHTGYRMYGEQHVERLYFIKRAQAIGFSLEEIAELLQLNDTQDHALARTLALGKIADIETRIAQLNRIVDALRYLVHECESGQNGTPCPIIRMAMEPPGDCDSCQDMKKRID